MKKTIAIFWHEFFRTLKRLSFIIVTLGIPVAMLIGWVVYQGVQQWYQPAELAHKVGYVDQTGLFDRFTDQPGLTLVQYADAASATGGLLSKDIDEYFVIPTDYLSTAHIQIYTPKKGVEFTSGTSAVIRDFIISNLASGKVTDQVLERLRAPMAIATFQLDQSGNPVTQKNELAEFFVPYIFGIMFIFSIFFTSGYLLQSVSEEKESRVVEVLLSSVSARQLLIGKTLGLGAAGLCRIAGWLVSVRILTSLASSTIPQLAGISIPTALLILAIVYFVLGYLLFAGLFAALGAIGNTARDAQQWSSIFSMPAVLPYMLQTVIVSNPEGPISRALTLFPITAPVSAMMRLPLGALQGWELALSIFTLGLSVLIVLWAASKVFRVGLLMYGKKPNPREILRYIVQS